MITFQEIIDRLEQFWRKRGCIIHQGYDLEVGAGTFNPATFLRSLGPEPYKAAYVEPTRRPKDGRYGDNPNRTQHYFQYQVILKPSPIDLQDLYLKSLEAIGFNLKEHDVRFVHDDWEAPTQGAWGLGWEVWIDGMEISQFTYFQCVGGQTLSPITGELTYGLERLAMYIQNKDSIFDLWWNEELTYGDIYRKNEIEWSRYNFETSNTEMWFRHFDDYEAESKRLIEEKLTIPAYDFVIKASHAFNMLDAAGVISVTERTGYISRIRELSRLIAEAHVESRKEQGFPLLSDTVEAQPPEIEPLKEEEINPKNKRDFILEIGSEEIPATFVPIGCRNLKNNIKKLLEKEELEFDDIVIYGTPRRLTAHIKGLVEGTESKTIERKGPKVSIAFDAEGNISKAGAGFFKSSGTEAPSRQNVEVRDEYVFATIEEKARSTAKILQKELPKLILSIDFPKKMRWANLDIQYARPLRWVFALFGKQKIPFALGNIIAGNQSSGHPQMCPGMFEIKNTEDYISALRKHFVMVDIGERKENILQQLRAIEKEFDGKVVSEEKVIAQTLHLVEWPQLTAATFKEDFLKAPKEVLVSEMVEHQKYFPMADNEGKLKNIFVIVANNTPSDKIRKGNQKVLSARLSDGVFLYEQDLKTSPELFNNKLASITFQKDLGSIFDKVERIVSNTKILHKYLKIGDLDLAVRAATLCKFDLASELVNEFPSLQGTIGKYYALAHGEDPKVAQAIEEHWMPLNEKGNLPSSDIGILVSLAEKFDNLISCFKVGLKPTSSSDPYALRRQVLGMIKILITGKYHLNIEKFLQECCNISSEVKNFITNRIKTVFLDYGFSKDEIEASLASGFEDIYDTFLKVKALHEFRKSGNQIESLLEVYKRAKGQLQNQKEHTFNEKNLLEKEEVALHENLCEMEKEFYKVVAVHDYDQAYILIASLQPYLADLFDNVLILAEDEKIRNNRIALLQKVFKLFNALLDFSKIL